MVLPVKSPPWYHHYHELPRYLQILEGKQGEGERVNTTTCTQQVTFT